ncbi:MAG: Nif3-like dinuclear metal center hexameric protein [Planctomycetota bacterium]|jgi:dinuclear metal center YbgI/SA1388 family protein
MQASHVIQALEALAPPEYAAEWDNVGLLIGSPQWEVAGLLLTVDLTPAVLREALGAGGRMVVAYHPPIFEPLARLTDATTGQRIALEAARGGVAVYSPHTALDAAPGGVNDWVAEGLGRGDIRALRPQAALPASEQCKLVTFCPADAADRLRSALATVGAGRIGGYELCSFEMAGTGTFLAGEDTSPRVGRKGGLQRVDELRLEMVCPEASLALAVTTLREFHPYEEPPIEIYRLEPRPQRGVGEGRRVVLDQELPLPDLVERVKRLLAVDTLRVAAGEGAPSRYRTIGLCPGAGGPLRPAATEQGCELFLTGEMRHHDVLAAKADGCTVVLAGHTNTERGYLRLLRKRLRAALPELTVSVSKKDADPLKAM